MAQYAAGKKKASFHYEIWPGSIHPRDQRDSASFAKNSAKPVHYLVKTAPRTFREDHILNALIFDQSVSKSITMLVRQRHPS